MSLRRTSVEALGPMLLLRITLNRTEKYRIKCVRNYPITISGVQGYERSQYVLYNVPVVVRVLSSAWTTLGVPLLQTSSGLQQYVIAAIFVIAIHHYLFDIFAGSHSVVITLRE